MIIFQRWQLESVPCFQWRRNLLMYDPLKGPVVWKMTNNETAMATALIYLTCH